jgi:hypothetical protein
MLGLEDSGFYGIWWLREGKHIEETIDIPTRRFELGSD